MGVSAKLISVTPSVIPCDMSTFVGRITQKDKESERQRMQLHKRLTYLISVTLLLFCGMHDDEAYFDPVNYD